MKLYYKGKHITQNEIAKAIGCTITTLRKNISDAYYLGNKSIVIEGTRYEFDADEYECAAVNLEEKVYKLGTNIKLLLQYRNGVLIKTVSL